MSTSEKSTPIRLLVVDDDESLSAMMQERFERSGMKVFATAQGQDAVELASQEQFDVVLLDINLPDANGLDLLCKLKELHSDVEVIMLTANGSIESAIQAMRSGAYV